MQRAEEDQRGLVDVRDVDAIADLLDEVTEDLWADDRRGSGHRVERHECQEQSAMPLEQRDHVHAHRLG